MSNLVKHSTVIAGSAFIFGEVGALMGESAANLEYVNTNLPFSLDVFESFGRFGGTYIGVISGLSAVIISRTRESSDI